MNQDNKDNINEVSACTKNESFLKQTKSIIYSETTNKKDRTQILESMPIKKAIWTLGIPTMIAMLVQVIYNMTDTFFIGQLNDPNMVAAITICMPVAFFVQTFGNIFAIGGASLISRMLGEGEKDNASHAAAISFWSALALCTITSVIGIIFIKPLLGFIGTSENTITYGKNYLIIILTGGPFMGLQMAMGGLLRSEGATKESMIGMMIGSILNIILDPILILVMNMGVEGAALATMLGNAFGFSYYIFFYLRKRGIISIAWKYFSFQKKYYVEILKIGVPASLGMVLMSIGMIVANVFAATYGDNVVAAYGIVFRITSIGFMIVLGLAQGCQPLMGYSYGSRNYKRLFDTIKYSNVASTIICIVFAVIFFIFAETWMRIFIKNNEVVDLGGKIMRIMMISMPFLGVQVVLMTLFQAIGKSVQSLILSLGRQGLFLIPFIVIFSSLWGFNGFICAEPFADIFTTILSLILYFAMRKQFSAKINDGSEIVSINVNIDSIPR